VLRVYGGIGANSTGWSLPQPMFINCCQNVTKHGWAASVARGQHFRGGRKKARRCRAFREIDRVPRTCRMR
jgi:hypothetical protein